MTHSTKAIYKWLIQDSVRVGNASSSSEQRSQLYTEADHLSTFPQIEAIDYHTTHTVSSIRLTPYPAGHVLGAAMFLIEIAGLKILFTGDYSRENDRHLIPAEVPKGIKIDILITESTFGISSHIPRLEREAALMKSITGILNRGGRALLPVFALGRAQELLLILDEYWAKHPEYQKIPIYYASSLARKCMVVYQTYIGAMNDNIKRIFRERMAQAEASGSTERAGPWDFRFIRSLKNLDRFDDVGGCVMLASPGMMQSGVSRELLERWAPDQRNGVVITGYSVEGTMARSIMQEPESITAIMTNRTAGGAQQRRQAPGREGEQAQVTIPRRCTVQEFSFAAHVDGVENQEFIKEVDAPVVILVHGEKHNMTRLKSKLLSLNAQKAMSAKTKVFSPANCEELRIPIRMDKTAKVVGRLAERIRPPPAATASEHETSDNGHSEDDSSQEKKRAREDEETGQIIHNAVLVQNDLKLSLMAPEDLREFAGLTTTTITCRQKITLAAAGVELIKWALEGAFGGIVELPSVKEVPSSTGNGVGKEPNGNGAVSSTSEQNNVKDEDDDDDDEYDPSATTTTIDRAVEMEPADEELPAQAPEIRLLIMDTVTLTIRPRGELEVEWEGNVMNDGIADAVMAVLLSVESAPASVKRSAKQHAHSHDHTQDEKSNGEKSSSISSVQAAHNPHFLPNATERLSRLLLFLEAQFGADAITPIAEPRSAEAASGAPSTATQLQSGQEGELPVPGLKIQVDKHVATVWLDDLTVECGSAPLRDRIKAVVERGAECVAPLWGGAVSAPANDRVGVSPGFQTVAV